MKFDRDAKEIFKYTRENLNNILNTVVSFREFCENVYNNNNFKSEAKYYLDFYKQTNSIFDIIQNKINPKFNELVQNFNDKHRPSVLYPYEKQAIYEYLTKPDFKHKSYKKFGCIYAEKIKIDGKEVVTIGISICNDIDSPLFSKNIAVNLAKKRAREYPKQYNIRVSPIVEDKHFFTKLLRIPTKIMYRNEINKFMTRCSKWFKGENILYPTNINFEEFPVKEKKKKSDKITNKEMPF